MKWKWWNWSAVGRFSGQIHCQKGSESVWAVFFKHWGFLGFVTGLIRLGDFCLVFQLLRRKWVACAVLENHWVVPTAESSVLVLYPWFGSPNWCLWTGLKIGCCRSSHKECRFLAASSYGSIGKEKRKMVCFSLSTLAEIPKAEKLCLSTKPTFAYKRQLFFLQRVLTLLFPSFRWWCACAFSIFSLNWGWHTFPDRSL